MVRRLGTALTRSASSAVGSLRYVIIFKSFLQVSYRMAWPCPWALRVMGRELG
jgi:hypothetical protein